MLMPLESVKGLCPKGDSAPSRSTAGDAGSIAIVGRGSPSDGGRVVPSWLQFNARNLTSSN